MKRKFSIVALLMVFSLWLEARELPADKSTQVEAGTATFDGEKIFLSGEVRVRSSSYTIVAGQATLLRDSEKKSNLEFPWVELKEKIHATFYEKYFLECDQVNLDYLTHTLIFSGKNQVYFYDATRKLFADSAYVEYVEDKGDFEVSRILLQGNVYMMSFPSPESAQYALADSVEYFPQEERIFLRADPHKRVLFCDKEKQLEISAQEVRAEKRPGDHKEMVEGIGDVRFTFIEEEFDKLKEKFNWK